MSQFKHYAPVSDKQLGFYIDSSRCSGCKACQVACKDKNNLEVGRRFRRVYEVNGGNFIPTGQGGVSNNVFAYTLSISCNHCADPVCTKNCPTTAMHKRPGDGIVRVSRETKGRGGKAVTLVKGVLVDSDQLEQLGKQLKTACGTGGTVKDGVIEVQGDHVEKVMAALQKLGHKVKRAGG